MNKRLRTGACTGPQFGEQPLSNGRYSKNWATVFTKVMTCSLGSWG